MPAELLYPTLAALAFVLALNLKLTLAALRKARRELLPATPPQPGQQLPLLVARRFAGRGAVELGAPGQTSALLFLSSQCPKCRAKLARIAMLAPAAHAAGLALWIVSDESRWRLRSLLRGSALALHTVRLGRRDYRLLNPLKSSPSYLFASHAGTIEAAGLIGDADWLALERQLTGADGVELAA